MKLWGTECRLQENEKINKFYFSGQLLKDSAPWIRIDSKRSKGIFNVDRLAASNMAERENVEQQKSQFC